MADLAVHAIDRAKAQLKEDFTAQLDAAQGAWLRAAQEPCAAVAARVEALGKQVPHAPWHCWEPPL